MCIVTEEFMEIDIDDIHIEYWQHNLKLAQASRDQAEIDKCDRILRSGFQKRWVHRIGMDIYGGKVDVSTVNPENGTRVVDSLEQKFQQDGWLRRCELNGGC